MDFFWKIWKIRNAALFWGGGNALMKIARTEHKRTLRMGYTRIETERAGRHLPRPYRGREIGAAYDAGMPDARVELTAQRRELREGAPGED